MFTVYSNDGILTSPQGEKKKYLLKEKTKHGGNFVTRFIVYVTSLE